MKINLYIFRYLRMSHLYLHRKWDILDRECHVAPPYFSSCHNGTTAQREHV